MKKTILYATALIAAVASCNKPEVDAPVTEEKVWVEFTTGAMTKVTREDVEDDPNIKHKFVWEENDAITVNGETFITSEAGDKVTFGAEVEASFLNETKFDAIYPATAGKSFDAITVPSVYDEVPESGFYGIVAVASSENQSFQFKHATSIVRFQVPAAVETVTISADQPLAGIISVEMKETAEVTVDYGINTVALTGDFETGKDYYVPVIAGEKSNLTVKFDGNLSKTWTTVTLNQGRVANMGVLPEPVVEKIEREMSFNIESLEVYYGEPILVTPTVGEVEGVVYTSSNTNVATVNPETGVITYGNTAGETTITATVEENDTYLEATASYSLIVTKAARTMSFSLATATLGDPNNFTSPTLSCEPLSDNVTYTSSDETIAKVDDYGTITRVKEGTVDITATVAETGTHQSGSASYTLTVLKESKWRVMGLPSWDYASAIKMYEENNMAVAKNVNINDKFKFYNSTNWVGLGAVTSNKVFAHIYNGDNMQITAGTYDIYISKNMTDSSGFIFLVPAGTDISEDNVLNYSYGLIGNGNWNNDFAKFKFDPRGYFWVENVNISDEFKIRQDNGWADSWGTGGTVTSTGATLYYNGGNSKATNNSTYDLYTDFCKMWLMTHGATPTL